MRVHVFAGASPEKNAKNSVAKSGILSRDVGIFLGSWDFFLIFILKSQSRDFFGIVEKGKFEV
jgi:hypothetical protein